MLDRLSIKPPPAKRLKHILPGQTILDFSLLKSSPPSGTELRESNIKLNAVLRQSPTIQEVGKRYIDRISRMCKTQNAELTILDKKLKKRDELLNKRKKKNGLN